MLKVKVMVNYPWKEIPGDLTIIEIDSSTGLTEEEISEIAYEEALDMIFDRGVSWDWEVIEED